jgi:hypothetical protein
MSVETIRKILCGRPPIETVWPEVYGTITQVKFQSMNSKMRGGCVMGVLSNSLKYWLPNYNHTRHILLSSTSPYSAEELIVVPSERDQIINVNEDRRRLHAMERSAPSHTSQRSSKTKHKSPKKILNLSNSRKRPRDRYKQRYKSRISRRT